MHSVPVTATITKFFHDGSRGPKEGRRGVGMIKRGSEEVFQGVFRKPKVKFFRRHGIFRDASLGLGKGREEIFRTECGFWRRFSVVF